MNRPISSFEVTVEGMRYPLRGDFLSVLKFMQYLDRSMEEDDLFLEQALGILYPCIPPNTDRALEGILTFYNGGTFPEEGYYSPLFLPEETENVFQTMKSRYGIDLYETPLFWWDFRRLWKERNNHGTRTTFD